MLKRLPFIGLLLAILFSPATAQNIVCPTAPFGTNDNRCASTAFVQGAVSGSIAGVASFNGRVGAVVPATNDYSFTQINGTNAVNKGGTGAVSFTSNLPLIGNGTGALTQGTVSGSTTIFVTTTGALASGDCVKIDASGNFIDAGAACGSGGGGSISGPATTTSGYLPTWGNGTGTLLGTGYPVGTTGANTVLLTGSGGLIDASVLPAFTGAVTISGGVTSYNQVVPANKGGAGTVTGALKADGSGNVSQAAATDLSNGTTGTGAVVLAGSPTLTGAPLAPTASPGTNTTQLATTAFVQAAVAGGGASTPYVQDFSSPGAVNSLTLTVGTAPVSSALLHVYFDGIDQAHTTWSLSGATINFNANIPSNTQVVEAQWLAPALAAGVNSIGGLTGVIACGSGLSCVGATISVTSGSLPALANDNIWIGNASNAAVAHAITGDFTLANTGVATFNTVNSNVGSFGSATVVPVITVNAKGLITAVANTSIVAPANTLSGTILNSTVITSSLTSVGALTSGSIGGSGFGINVGTTTLSGTVPAANLPVATSSTLGIMRTDGSTLSVAGGLVSCTLGSVSQIGCVKPDGVTITINGSGALVASAAAAGVSSRGNASADNTITLVGTGGGPYTGAVTAKLNQAAQLTLTGNDVINGMSWINANPPNLFITEPGGSSCSYGDGHYGSFGIQFCNLTVNQKRGIVLNIETASNAGTINTTGILVDIYTPADNGGDVSGIYVNQHGSGNAMSVYQTGGIGGLGRAMEIGCTTPVLCVTLGYHGSSGFVLTDGSNGASGSVGLLYQVEGGHTAGQYFIYATNTSQIFGVDTSGNTYIAGSLQVPNTSGVPVAYACFDSTNHIIKSAAPC